MTLYPSVVQLSFLFCCVITGLVMWLTKEAASGKPKVEVGEGFRGFQRLYLAVYLLAMLSDWLQGPYVYALYASYNISQGDNATLFVAGFGSSLLFGTIVGSMADSTGRKKSALLYCVLYIVSCLTKHVSNYYVLMIGRITGGIATSLLFSVFESWLVCEHNARGFRPELLGETFGYAILGNSVVAIGAGVGAEFVADLLPLTPPVTESMVHFGGYCSPFDVSILCLVLCAVAAQFLWTENYGDKDVGAGAGSQIQALRETATHVIESPEILCCGLVTLFEASMYIFVFHWTPAVTGPGDPKPPYGHIFASFMVACMLGSRVFALATRFARPELVGQAVLLVALCSHLVPVVSSDPTVAFFAFMIFELCCGAYFPMIGTLKGAIVPEAARSTIYSFYRVPMNFLVVLALILKVPTRTAFCLTSTVLLFSLIAMAVLARLRPGTAREPDFSAVSPEAPPPRSEVEFADGQVLGRAASDQDSEGAQI